MVQILINGNITKIKTNELEVNIEGTCEIKKEGAEAPIVNVASV